MVRGGQQTPAPTLLSPHSKMGMLQLRGRTKGLVPHPLTRSGEAPGMPQNPQPWLLEMEMCHSWEGGGHSHLGSRPSSRPGSPTG